MLAVSLSIGMCDKAASGVDYRQCLGHLSETVDAELERQWQKTLAAVREEDRISRGEKANKPDLEPDIRAAQEAWLGYRDAQCSMMAAQAAGGAGVGEIEAECHIAMTRQQIGLLDRLAAGHVYPRAMQ